MKSASRWCLWLACLVVWTALLLAPLDAAGLTFAEAPQWHFTITTAAHVIGYASLTFGAGWLRGESATRLWLLFLLSAHAVLSELVQPWFERTGCLEDAAFDMLGILIGLLLGRRYWFPS